MLWDGQVVGWIQGVGIAKEFWDVRLLGSLRVLDMISYVMVQVHDITLCEAQFYCLGFFQFWKEAK